MRNFFISGLRSNSLEAIRQAGVAYSDFDSDGTRGILIEESSLPLMLQTLNMSVFQEDTTRFDGVFSLVLAPANVQPVPPRDSPADLNVQNDGWSETLSDVRVFIRALEIILLPVVQKKVVLYGFGNGDKRRPQSDGVFRVFMWAGARSERGSGDYSGVVWDLSIPSSQVWFAPSGDGITIRAPENGAAIAEILGDNLYILAPVAYYTFGDGPKIFRRILEEVAAELSLSPEQRAERDRQRVEVEKEKVAREHVQTRVAYIELCKQRLSKVVEEARQRVAKSEGVLEETQTSIVSTHRELAGSRKKLEQLRQIKEAEDQRFAQEFDRICAIPQVEDVLMRNGRIMQIMTSVLTCTDPSTGKIYELGKFRIEIPVNGGNIHWFNLTRQIDGLEVGMHSPVVDANGCTILINAIQAFPELIANYEIATAVQLALQVPGSIDPGEEHAKHLDKWPLVSAA